MESGQRAFIERSGGGTQKLGGALGPEQWNAADPRRAEHRKIRAVKAQGRDDGYVRPSHPGVMNVLRATRTAAAWRVTESNSLDRSRPLTMSCSRTGATDLRCGGPWPWRSCSASRR